MLSGRTIGSDVGVEDKKALEHVQNLSLAIQAGLSTPKLFSGIGSAGIEGRSASTDSLSKNISEFNSYKDQLSHSSNQNIRDAFSKTDSLSSSTSNLVSDVTSTSKALSDVKSNSSSVNSDFTTAWANHMRGQGMTDEQILKMSPQDMDASANSYVNQYLHDKYGIKNNVVAPSAHHHGAAMPKSPNTDGLVLPSDASTTAIDMNKAQARVNEKVNNFNEKPGDIIGGQLLEQGTTGVKVIKNAASNAVDIVKKATD